MRDDWAIKKGPAEETEVGLNTFLLSSIRALIFRGKQDRGWMTSPDIIYKLVR